MEGSSAQGAFGLAPTRRQQPRNQRDFSEVLLLFVALLSKHLKNVDYILYSSLVHSKICPQPLPYCLFVLKLDLA